MWQHFSKFSDFDSIQSNSKIHIYVPYCSGLKLGVPPGVELEVSLLVVLVLPAVVSVDVITWVVSAGPSTGHVDMQLVVLVLPAAVTVGVITWVVSAGPSTGHVDMQLVVLVLPAAVTVGVITWVVSVGPSNVQVYMQST